MKHENHRARRTLERLEDEYLVARAKSGDRDAFGQLVSRWQSRLLAHAWRLTGDREQARDAAQAGWAQIVRGLARLRDERAFPAWAYRIVSRQCAQAIGRRVKRREIAAAMAEDTRTTAHSPDQETAADGADLRRLVRELPPAQRAALALYHFEGLSVAETAVALDIPVGTVKTRLMHGRRALRAAFEGDE